MGQMRQLMGPTESDSVDLFKASTKWCVFGYTRAELAAVSSTTIVDINTPRTALLAKLALLLTVPAAIGAAKLVDLGTAEIDDSDNYYEFDLQYEGGPKARPPANETTPAGGPLPSIRIAAQSVTRQVANGPIRVYGKTGETAPAAPKGILPDGKGDFRGAAVMIPMLSWSEPHVVAAADFSLAKGKQLVGKVNAATFRGFAAGTVVCVGANANQRADGKWDVSVEFQHSDNLAGTAPGFDDFEDVDKKGWEFLFPLTNDAKEVVALCVAPIYDTVDYSTIVPSLGPAV